MRLILTATAAALALSAAAPAQARDPRDGERYTPAFDQCTDRQGTTHGLIECVVAEYAIQDQALNEAYRKAMAGLNARQKAKLQAAQRAWIAWRDARCKALEDEDWGTLSRLNANICMLDTTVDRTQELEEYPPSNG